MGCFCFIVLTVVTMAIYPGGTWFSPATRGYPFFRHLLSDLGMTVAYSGMPHSSSMILFVMLAFGVGGADLILSFVLFPRFVRRDVQGKLLLGGHGR